MTEFSNKTFTGERACFFAKDASFTSCTFTDGESPLKEGENLIVRSSTFGWKYPLWYCKSVLVENCHWLETGRAGVWYSNDLTVKDSLIEGAKNFRRCKGLSLENVSIPNALETLWDCEDVSLRNVKVKGEYLAMNAKNATIENLELDGDYPFDGAKNVTIRHSVLHSKDSFWNSENIVLEDCLIEGEYFGWNSKNITLINCTIISHQGFCYMEGVTLKGCKLKGTSLSFEYCKDIDAEILDEVDSIKNPISGRIVAKGCGEVIRDDDKLDHSKTEIILG